jgi:hypothetical protein
MMETGEDKNEHKLKTDEVLKPLSCLRDVLFLHEKQKSMAGTLLRLATQIYVLFKTGCGWATLGSLGGPLGTQPILPKPNLVGAYPDTWLSLLESHVRRCGTRVHTCSKLIAQVGVFHY